MEKRQYEVFKALKEKVISGKATFAERNVLRIIEKKRAKGQAIHGPIVTKS